MSMSTRALFVLPLLLAVGCGGPHKVARVSGRVTLDGKPLANAAVVFQPIAGKGKVDPGPGSGGFTDAEGRYTLTLTGKNTRGAVVGKHKVQITLVPPETSSADDQAKPVRQLPAQYNRRTKLEYDVPAGGTDKADFPLTSR
jgi:hypothetical protein